MAFGGAQDSERKSAENEGKNLGDMLYKVMQLLKRVVDHKPVGADYIRQQTGVDLRGSDEEVSADLRDNPRISVTTSESGEIFYAYKTIYDVKDRRQLVPLVENNPHGLSMRDLLEDCPKMAGPITEAVRCGHLIAVKNAGTGEDILYPRGIQYLTQLSVEARGLKDQSSVEVTRSAADEIRTGDAIRVGDKWYRVCPAAGGTGPFILNDSTGAKGKTAWKNYSVTVKKKKKADEEKPIHFSSILNGDEAPRIQLDRPLDSNQPPLTRPPPGGAPQQYPPAMPVQGTAKVLKYGCSNDIRQMWKDTVSHWPSTRGALDRLMIKAKLTTQKEVDKRKRPLRQQQSLVERPKKQRKQRDYNSLKLTNTHLNGTELGRALGQGNQ